MIFNMCISLVIIFLVICIWVKYYTKIIRSRINLQIWEMLNEMFDIDIIDMKQFNINNTKQTLVLLQVILGALSDAMQFFKDEHNIDENHLTEVCLQFALQKCKELDVEVNTENEHFIKTIILNYLETHKVSITE